MNFCLMPQYYHLHIKIADTNFHPNISPVDFEMQSPSYNMPLYILALSKYKPLKKEVHWKYKPWGLFLEFYSLY